MDSKDDEQARGITMKSSSISLLHVPGAAARPEGPNSVPRAERLDKGAREAAPPARACAARSVPSSAAAWPAAGSGRLAAGRWRDGHLAWSVAPPPNPQAFTRSPPSCPQAT